MPFTLHPATPADAPAIARIFLSANETDDFLRLQFGSVDPGVMNQGLTERLEESIRGAKMVYVVAKTGEGEVVSYASWAMPRGEGEGVGGEWGSEEEKAAATEAYRAKLLPGMNAPLVMDFREEIGAMQERVLGERRYYMLGNLGTLPAYRRQGAASALIRWPFEKADEEGVVVYLDTDELGDAKRMYDRLGFKKVDEAVFDLSKYGGSGVHTHIGMVREPQPQGST